MCFDRCTSYKLKTEACKKGSAKELNLRNIAVNYLSVLIFISLHIQGSTDYFGDLFVSWGLGIAMEH